MGRARYANRRDAGEWLATHLGAYAGRSDVHVLGLPRGGVVTAAAIAEALRAPLDVFVVRKLGVPWHPELAMGAVASGGVRVLNDDVVAQLRITAAEIDEAAATELAELRRRERAYRGDRPPLVLRGKVAILVDDGLATGATARAAVAAARKLDPAWIVLAVPVAPRDVLARLGDPAAGGPDQTVCPLVPRVFDAVGYWYDDFAPTSDAEVRELLEYAGPPAGRNEP